VTKIFLWAMLILAATYWVRAILGLVLGSNDLGCLVLAITCSSVAVALTAEVKPWRS
jgi:hypothetical protein